MASRIPVTIATEVVVKGQVVARRLADAIDPQLKADVIKMVKDRLDGNKLYTEQAKENIQSVEVTSMPHPSAMDPEPHCTIEATEKGGRKKKQHVTVDADKQQPAM